MQHPATGLQADGQLGLNCDQSLIGQTVPPGADKSRARGITLSLAAMNAETGVAIRYCQLWTEYHESRWLSKELGIAGELAIPLPPLGHRGKQASTMRGRSCAGKAGKAQDLALFRLLRDWKRALVFAEAGRLC